MITEPQQEQACLYVLGALPADEARAFEKLLQADAALREFTTKLQDVNAALALSAKPVSPSADLKARVLAALPAGKIARPEFRRADPPNVVRLAWLPWALAACLAILCTIFVAKTHSLQSEIARLSAVRDQQITQLTSIQSALEELRAKDRMSEMRITMLSSLLESSPKAMAVSVWDAEKQDGVLFVQNLAPLPTDKDYQLWVIDPKVSAPVDAGVFTVDEKGAVRLRFKPKANVNTAGTFAVTLEKKGGVAAPQGRMVLSGNSL
jgi:anti-sigma-K factor RskA